MCGSRDFRLATLFYVNYRNNILFTRLTNVNLRNKGWSIRLLLLQAANAQFVIPN